MWIRLITKEYVNINNGYLMGVKTSSNSSVSDGTWRVWFNTGVGQPQYIVEDGYRSEKEAQDALDSFMAEQKLVQMSPPITDEETGDNNGDGEVSK